MKTIKLILVVLFVQSSFAESVIDSAKDIYDEAFPERGFHRMNPVQKSKAGAPIAAQSIGGLVEGAVGGAYTIKTNEAHRNFLKEAKWRSEEMGNKGRLFFEDKARSLKFIGKQVVGSFFALDGAIRYATTLDDRRAGFVPVINVARKAVGKASDSIVETYNENKPGKILKNK